MVMRVGVQPPSRSFKRRFIDPNIEGDILDGGQLRIKLYKYAFAMRDSWIKCYTNAVFIQWCLNNPASYTAPHVVTSLIITYC